MLLKKPALNEKGFAMAVTIAYMFLIVTLTVVLISIVTVQNSYASNRFLTVSERSLLDSIAYDFADDGALTEESRNSELFDIARTAAASARFRVSATATADSRDKKCVVLCFRRNPIARLEDALNHQVFRCKRVGPMKQRLKCIVRNHVRVTAKQRRRRVLQQTGFCGRRADLGRLVRHFHHGVVCRPIFRSNFNPSGAGRLSIFHQYASFA